MKHQKPKEMFRITRLIAPTFLVFLLSACGPPPAEDCAVVGDEDGNGAADCQDAACSALPQCAPEVVCNDAVDNDGDGTTDCQDIDCANNPACLPEVDCADGVDNDIDTLTDCADDDCAGTADCVEADCQDGQDNDTDGDTDCDDADCLADVTCIPEGICDDGLDDDLDGDTDCADADCANDPICLALCGNGLIDLNEECDDGNAVDGDGCNAICQQEFCGDGVIQLGLGETCDPPDGTSCDDFCQRIPICGDSVIDLPEQCDDGNLIDDDGCSAACLVEDAGFDCSANQTLVQISSTDVPKAILDNVTVTSIIDVTGVGGVVARVIVGIDDITHTFDGDVDIFLNSPTGLQVELSTNNGGGGANYTGTILDDNCLTVGGPITSGVAPFTGCFSPELPLADLQGEAPDGTWTLEILDDLGGFEGTLNAWTLGLCVEFPVCGDGVVNLGEDCDPPDGVTCDDQCQKIPLCGDNVLDVGEECEPPDGNVTCDDLCQRVPVCGDSLIDGAETCDDGNTTDGDCCAADCTLEAACVAEIEPNEDGTPDLGVNFPGIEGNDFDSANANGPFSEDVLISASLNPAGDEDVFAVFNESGGPVTVQLDTFNPVLGVGVPCGATIDTVIHIRDAAGTSLASNDDRDGFLDRCSTLDFTIPPGETVFAHVSAFDDGIVISGYLLVLDFPVCGDGALDPGEECDPPDGVACSDFCQNIPVCGDGVIETPEEVCEGADLQGEDCITQGFASGTLACSGDCATFDTSACVPPICNNGIVEPGEQCEDGNANPGDGCDQNCLFEPQAEVEPNDGVIEALNNDAFTPNVLITGALDVVGDRDFFAIDIPLVADLRVETFDETGPPNCAPGKDTLVRLFDPNGSTELINDNDDGVDLCSLIDPSVDAAARALPPGTYFIGVEENFNDAAIAGYTLVITFDALCGDGIVQSAEQCDPPDGVTCDDQCQRIPTCGDGFIDFPEQCEDGNLTPGDGCDENCQVEGAGFSCFAGETLVLVPSANVPVALSDNATFTSVVDITDVGTVQRVIVGIDELLHPFDAALEISLISPAGTPVGLSIGNGFDPDFIGTIFDDNCIALDGPIAGGLPPFTGCFSPDGLLAGLQGEASDGTWTLQITDTDGFGDLGSLNAWTLGLCIQ